MHPYVRYRTHMARHSLRQFLASVLNSLEVAGLAFAPVLLGLLAFISMPVMMAATRDALSAVAAVAGQAVLLALPVALLRKRLHPADAVAWERALPVPPALGWRADWLVAGHVVGWMAGACMVSAAIWVYQWPLWLRPAWGRSLCALALSIALGWALAAAIVAARRLGLRNPRIPRRPRGSPTGPAQAQTQTLVQTRAPGAEAGTGPSASPASSGQAAAMPLPARVPATAVPTLQGSAQAGAAYRASTLHPSYLALWHRLFWLPFWRLENRTGTQQVALLLAALAGALAWTCHALPLPRAALGLFTSAALILLVDRGDKAVREQAKALAPSLAMWPLAHKPLLLAARTFTLLPAALVLAVAAAALASPYAAAAGHLRHGLAAAWTGVAAAAALAIVVLPSAPRGRVVLVTLSILLLTAIGSELWA